MHVKKKVDRGEFVSFFSADGLESSARFPQSLDCARSVNSARDFIYSISSVIYRFVRSVVEITKTKALTSSLVKR